MSTPTHGSYTTYGNHGCRCADCRTAWRLWSRERRAQRIALLALDPSLAEHGKASTYVNWGCRCSPCSEARRIRDSKLPSRRRSEPPPT